MIYTEPRERVRGKILISLTMCHNEEVEVIVCHKIDHDLSDAFLYFF